VLPPDVPAVTIPSGSPVQEQILHVAAAFQRRNTSEVAGPVAADLTLEHAHVPQSGGRFVFYLLDPNTNSGIPIGHLSVVGPTYQAVGTVHVYVELTTRALEVLRETRAPKVRIVQERQGGGPLMVGSIELRG